jgi:hypothetical protein
LRHYAASQKVAGSIPDVTGFFFHLPHPSNGILALVFTQPVTKMNFSNLPVG